VVYNALNDANIEIPYPQRDVHIVSDTAHQVQHADSLDEAEKMIFKDKKA
jgi:small-conductance mechanosensitive channel